MPQLKFFSLLNNYTGTPAKLNYRNSTQNPPFSLKHDNAMRFLQCREQMRNFMRGLDAYQSSNYLCDIFTDRLSDYSMKSSNKVKEYLASQLELNEISKDFIRFCFNSSISMDKDLTLKSFSYHNSLSDGAIKKQLLKIEPKKSLNLLGFGLDDGEYEKGLIKYLINNRIAGKVKLFGFDPYAEKNKSDIEFVTPEQLTIGHAVKYDIITARWALHHVEMKYRWQEFMACLGHVNPDATVLIVEHGFVKEKVRDIDERLYKLFNATFDIIANIGLRPQYFLSTYPDVGANFFIHYLTPKDFNRFNNRVQNVHFTQSIYDVGPGFPNQTICNMRERSLHPILKR